MNPKAQILKDIPQFSTKEPKTTAKEKQKSQKPTEKTKCADIGAPPFLFWVDFCLFSGTFNLTHGANPDLWLDYIFYNLSACFAKSRQGLILNLICKPKIKIEQQIFYVNRAAFIARATDTLGPTRAITTPHVNDDVTFFISKP